MTKRTLMMVAVLIVAVAELFLVSRVGHAHRVADQNRAELSQAQHGFGAVEAATTKARTALGQTQVRLAARGEEAERAWNAQVRDTRLLNKAAHNLTAANTTLATTAASLAALDACVRDSQKATFLRNGGDAAAAVLTLKFAQPVCASLATPGDREAAVFPFDFSDPSILVSDGTYYAYSTNSAMGDLPVISSTDLVHWNIIGNALPVLPKWAIPGATWAPSVVKLGGRYVAYYTARRASDWVQCISVAVSPSPAGPFLDGSTAPMICDAAGSIDPQAFVDRSGRATLLWKSEASGGDPARIASAPLRGDGLALTDFASVLIRADQAWERGVVEAPSFVETSEGLALFYSGNNWNSADYALGEARCASPAGPCAKHNPNPVFASHGSLAGPGSATAFAAPDGQLWLLYNAFNAAHVGYPASRLLHVAKIDVTRDTVTVTAP